MMPGFQSFCDRVSGSVSIPEILIIICSPQNILPRCPIKQKGRQQVAVQLIDVVLIDVKNYIVLHVHPSSKFVDIYSGLEQSLIPLI